MKGKKHRKTRDALDISVSSLSPIEDATPSSSKKKNKRKRSIEDPDESGLIDPNETGAQEESSVQSSLDGSYLAPSHKKHKKKRSSEDNSRKDETTDSTFAMPEPVSSKKKHKKKKKKSLLPENEESFISTSESDLTLGSPESKKSKKKKGALQQNGCADSVTEQEGSSVKSGSSSRSRKRKHEQSSQDSLSSDAGGGGDANLKHTGPAEATTQELEQSDVEMLLSRLRDQLPESDVLSHTIQVKRVEWEEVKFGEFSAKDCEEMWNKILKSMMFCRTLSSLVDEAKQSTPVIMTKLVPRPKAPINPPFIFWRENAEKLSRKMAGVSINERLQKISEEFKKLSEKEKKKYTDAYEKQYAEYKVKLAEYKKKNHMEPPARPKTPILLYQQKSIKKHLKKNPEEKRDKKELMAIYREKYKRLSDQARMKWINKSIENSKQYEEELKAYQEMHPGSVLKQSKSDVLSIDDHKVQAKAKGRPEKPGNAYAVFRASVRESVIEEHGTRNWMQHVADMWKNVPQKEKDRRRKEAQKAQDEYKQKFETYLQELSPEEREREEEQMKRPPKKKPFSTKKEEETEEDVITIDNDEEKTEPQDKETQPSEGAKANKKRKKKDPNAPKQPWNAYRFFVAETMPKLKDITSKERFTKVSELWKGMSDEDKEPYKERAEEAKRVAALENLPVQSNKITKYLTPKKGAGKKETKEESDTASKDSSADDEPKSQKSEVNATKRKDTKTAAKKSKTTEKVSSPKKSSPKKAATQAVARKSPSKPAESDNDSDSDSAPEMTSSTSQQRNNTKVSSPSKKSSPRKAASQTVSRKSPRKHAKSDSDSDSDSDTETPSSASQRRKKAAAKLPAPRPTTSKERKDSSSSESSSASDSD